MHLMLILSFLSITFTKDLFEDYYSKVLTTKLKGDKI